MTSAFASPSAPADVVNLTHGGGIRQPIKNAPLRDQVYFIRQRGIGGFVKIGCSKEPKLRVGHLANWSPLPLEIVAIMDGDYALERRFHALFESHHVGREWFTVTPELERVIAEINSGEFEVETLPEPKQIGRTPGINRKKPYIKTVHTDGFVEVAQLRFIPIAQPEEERVAA